MAVENNRNLLSEQNMSELVAALKLTVTPLSQAQDLLNPLLPKIGNAERAVLPRPFSEFPAAAMLLMQAMEARPQMMTLTGFDSGQIRAQLMGASELTAYMARLEEMQQMLSDTRLLLLADAWTSSLEVYKTAKGLEHLDPSLRTVIRPIADIFKGGKSTKKT